MARAARSSRIGRSSVWRSAHRPRAAASRPGPSMKRVARVPARVMPDSAQVLGHGGKRHALHQGGRAGLGPGAFGSHQEQVALGDLEEARLGEHVGEAAHHRAEVLHGHAVDVHPLAEEAAWGQARARDREEFPREQARHPGHPGVRGLGDDHVEAAGGQQQVVPRVGHAQPQPRIREDPGVHVAEVRAARPPPPRGRSRSRRGSRGGA